MALLIILAVVTGMAGVVLGAYIKICLAIRKEDRGAKWSLRRKAISQSARTARALVGLTSSRWR